MAEIVQIFPQNMHSVPPSEQGQKSWENIFVFQVFFEKQLLKSGKNTTTTTNLFFSTENLFFFMNNLQEIVQIFSQNMHSVPPSEQGQKFWEKSFVYTFF